MSGAPAHALPCPSAPQTRAISSQPKVNLNLSNTGDSAHNTSVN